MSTARVTPKILRRSTVVGAIIAIAFFVLAVRILWLQTAGFEKYQNLVISQMTTVSKVKAERGKIYDRNGNVLATSITAYRVFISPKSIEQNQKEVNEGTSDKEVQVEDYVDLICRQLSKILDISYDKIKEHTTYTQYLDRTVARDVNEECADRIRALISEYELEDMIYLEATSKRYYPNNELASHLIGFTSNDGTGLYGLELQYNSYLSGTDGKYITARDSHGNEMPYDYESYIPPQNGYDIITTTDIYVQSVLEEELLATLTECQASNRACGIVMDVKTGAILAMATSEGYDLNAPRELNDYYTGVLAGSGYEEGSEEYTKLRQELLFEMWQNKAITDTYMPGSTFKVITTAMTLEENLVQIDEMFTCTGAMKVGNRTIKCHKLTGHGHVTFARGLQESCNPVLMTIGLRLGTEKYESYFDAFGYFDKTGVDLPGEANSIFFDPFTEIDLAVASFGRNFKITALQQLCGIVAVANGGYLMQPYVVDKIVDASGNPVYEVGNTEKRQVVSTEVCRTIADILEEGVSGGYGGKNCYVAGYKIAAKTGTSEKMDKVDENGERSYRVASCIAYAPADDPQVAMIFIVDEPTVGTRYGSQVAAPYVANVMEAILPHLGIDPEYTEEELANLAIETPSLVYWYPEQAKEYAETVGFEVELVGEGKFVMQQSPAKGVLVEKKNARIVLYLGDAEPQNDVSVPDLIGKTAVAANQLLVNAGLNIKLEGSSTHLAGTSAVVISQSHAPGELVGRGEVITVVMRYVDEEEITYG